MYNKIKNSENKGFTLIELMVAISIFMMVMVMAMGGVIVASDAAKKADKLRTAMDNVNFAMESMTRSIRMGTSYIGTNGDDAFAFTSSSGDHISYNLEGDKLQRCDIGCSSMVSSGVAISQLQFYPKGTDINDGIQPSVYIIMKGTVNVNGESYSFALQTMASQRNLEPL